MLLLKLFLAVTLAASFNSAGHMDTTVTPAPALNGLNNLVPPAPVPSSESVIKLPPLPFNHEF